MICFNSGCSFNVPNLEINLANEQMYWYLLAKDLGCTTFINQSVDGCSNEEIFRRVYAHVLENTDDDVLYFINLTSLNRIDLSAQGTSKLQDVLTKESIVLYDYEIRELGLFTQLIGLISFLDQHNKKFYVVNNSKALSNQPYPLRDTLVKYLSGRSELLNVFDNSKYEFHKDVSKIKPWDYDDYGWFGHDGVEGHYVYYQMLKTLI
jgi:hypothetical protein